MFSRSRILACWMIVATGVLSGCGDSPEQPPKPVVLRGHVVSTSGTAIAGAVVSALDVNDAPVAIPTVTGTAGEYELDVSAARNQSIRLQAAASGYESFPSGIRRSIPIDLAGAVEMGPILVVQNLATNVSLEPLTDASGLGSLAGTTPGGGGVLVVAEGPAVLSTISALDGSYVLFNLLPGTYQVRGYAAGRQFVPGSAVITAGQQTADVVLAVSNSPLGSVSGNVSLVNAPGGSKTSVVLVVAATFNAVLQRGDVPPGLRAPRTGVPSVSGAFTIGDVPDGTYKVLAAFENDGLVRDPDPNIAGTQIVEVTVNGNATQIPTTFKITGALAVASPGAGDRPEAVSGTPTLSWADDSSEDFYTVEVFDTTGNTVWSDGAVPSVSGSPTVSVVYGGPALELGRTYQFRATSWRDAQGVPGPISHTEDLRGVFIVQ